MELGIAIASFGNYKEKVMKNKGLGSLQLCPTYVRKIQSVWVLTAHMYRYLRTIDLMTRVLSL